MIQFIVAKTFYAAKRSLANADAARADRAMMKVQEDPKLPGLSMERLTNVLDPNMWSARASDDLRLILHRTGQRTVVLYVGHHDDAYEWAKKRRLGHHPVTGAMQIVHIPEVTIIKSEEEPIEEVVADATRPSLNTESAMPESVGHLTAMSDAELLSYGVPTELLDEVRAVRDEDELTSVLQALPEEAGERLLQRTTGQAVPVPKPVSPQLDPAANPDNLRRFHVPASAEELEQMLSRPFQEWLIFLHPTQRAVVESASAGPVKITGGAGTGKTVVAVHRARWLARQGIPTLISTFTRRLTKDIDRRVGLLCTAKERALVTVSNYSRLALRMLRAHEQVSPLDPQTAIAMVQRYHGKTETGFDRQSVIDEWQRVIDRHGIREFEEYASFERIGRRTSLGPDARRSLWRVFGPCIEEIHHSRQLPWAFICRRVRELITQGKLTSPYKAVIIDEVQDLSTQEILMLSSLCGGKSPYLMLVGDTGQRIFPGGFSLRRLGIEVRGRSYKLSISYRTPRQIQIAAAGLRGDGVDDMDQGQEDSAEVPGILQGVAPVVRGFSDVAEEHAFVISELKSLLASGVGPGEIAVFARVRNAYEFLIQKLRKAGISAVELREEPEQGNRVGFGTLFEAKGLEFRYVFVVACRDSLLPADFEIEKYKDSQERDEATQRERTLLYVGMTRAREKVFITWTGRKSRFLSAVGA